MCFKIMKGVISDLNPEIIIADELYDFDTNLFGINEMPEEEIKQHALEVAKKVADNLWINLNIGWSNDIQW